MRDALIIQMTSTPDIEESGFFYDMLRMTVNRHAAYARAHKMDYQAQFGDYLPERGVYTGAWHKIAMIRDALEKGYEYVFWVDTDAGIVDFGVDLRSAFTGDGDIGAVEHDANNIPKHLNVGVVFVRNTERARQFIKEWWDSFPGEERWVEQGSFNKLAEKYPDVVFRLDDKWNSTVGVNESDDPIIKGWHGVVPPKRYEMMKKYFREDHIRFRV